VTGISSSALAHLTRCVATDQASWNRCITHELIDRYPSRPYDPALDLGQATRALSLEDAAGSLDLGEVVLEAVVGAPTEILDLKLVQSRPKRAHTVMVSEHVFDKQ
jgi:hypothetical protein